MRVATAKIRNTGIRRAVRFAPTIISILLVYLVALPHAVATFQAGAFPRATWTANTTKWVQAYPHSTCGRPHVGRDVWSPWSGIGYLKAGAFAADCILKAGAVLHAGAAQVTQGLTVVTPLALPTGPGGVNVSWDLNVSYNVSFLVNGSISPVKCPGIVDNWSTNLSNTWINSTEETYNCGALSGLDLNAFAYLIDLTTNRTFGPSHLSPWAHDVSAGVFNYTDKNITTYSNPHFWQRNSSAVVYINESGGPSVSGIMNLTPRWFINGSFLAGDKYELVTWIRAGVTGFYDSYASGYASARLDMASGISNSRLLPIVTW